MPLIAVFASAISMLTGFLITKVLLALGLGYVTFMGISSLLEWVEIEYILVYNSMPADLYAIATLAGLDVAFTIIISAVFTSWMIATLGAGVKTLLRFTTPV